MKITRAHIMEQARIAKQSIDQRPEWAKRISYFAGTNTVCAVAQRDAAAACGAPTSTKKGSGKP